MAKTRVHPPGWRRLPVHWVATRWPVPLHQGAAHCPRWLRGAPAIIWAGLTSSGSSGTRERLKPLLRP